MRSPDFEHAYDEQLARVYGFFARRVNAREDAEDLTQHTFERALQAWDRFDPRRATLGTWLLAIARNLLIDYYRARSPEGQPLDELDPSSLPRVDGPAERVGVDPELADALAGLMARDRQILALRYGGDLSGAEIAAATGLTVSNVQQILSRSLRRLRLTLCVADVGHAPAGP